jgi:general secretion pathway protein N
MSAGALVGLVFSLLVFAPARWLAQALTHFSGARLQLVQAQGTVWQGSAQLVLGAGSGSLAHTALPGRVQWNVLPTRKGLDVGIAASCCLTQDWRWTVTPSLSGVRLVASDQPSVWPSALLTGLGTPWNTLQLQGALTLSTQDLALQLQGGTVQMSGRVQLDALNLSSSLSTLRPMGSYRLTLNGGASPTLNLSTLQGSLHLTGQGQWVGGRLRFDGEASAAPDRAAALANLLNIIGRREGARSIIKVG